MHGEDMEEAEAEASWYASWNASGTFVAVTSNALTRVTVYNMTTRQVVRQALSCCAQRYPFLGVRRQAGLQA